MVLLILLVLALFVFRRCCRPVSARRRPPGTGPPALRGTWATGTSPPPERMGGRAARALANMQEALPVFLALALLNMIVGRRPGTDGCTVSRRPRALRARLPGRHPGLRTLIWAAGVVGLVLMLIRWPIGRIPHSCTMGTGRRRPRLTLSSVAKRVRRGQAQRANPQPSPFARRPYRTPPPPQPLRSVPVSRNRGMSQDSALACFSCSLSSLRSAFICLVSIGRISLMKHRSRPTMTFSNLSTVLAVEVTAIAFANCRSGQ